MRMSAENCILWQGALSEEGYGKKFYQVDGKQKFIYAHRFIYVKTFGRIPDKFVIHHLCGNHACVNSAHLQAMSRTDHKDKHAPVTPSTTYCKRGHMLTGDNLAFHLDGRRACRICSNATARARYKKKKEAVNAFANTDATATARTSTRVNREIYPR